MALMRLEHPLLVGQAPPLEKGLGLYLHGLLQPLERAVQGPKSRITLRSDHSPLRSHVAMEV
jgi:hypothetical protein